MKKQIHTSARYKGSKYQWVGDAINATDFEDQIIAFCDGEKSLWCLMFNNKHNTINAVLGGIRKRDEAAGSPSVGLQLNARHKKAKGRYVVGVAKVWIDNAQVIREYLTGNRVYYRQHPSSCWRIAEGPLTLNAQGHYTTDALELYKDYGPTFTEITHVSLEEVVRKPVMESYKADLDPEHREQIEKDLEAALAEKMQAKAEQDAKKVIFGETAMYSTEKVAEMWNKVAGLSSAAVIPVVDIKNTGAYAGALGKGMPLQPNPGFFMQQCGRAYRERLGGLEQQAEKVIRKAIMEIVYHEDRIGPSHRAHGMASRIIRKIKEQVGEAPKPSEPSKPVVNPEPNGICGGSAKLIGIGLNNPGEPNQCTEVALNFSGSGSYKIYSKLRDLMKHDDANTYVEFGKVKNGKGS